MESSGTQSTSSQKRRSRKRRNQSLDDEDTSGTPSQESSVPPPSVIPQLGDMTDVHIPTYKDTEIVSLKSKNKILEERNKRLAQLNAELTEKMKQAGIPVDKVLDHPIEEDLMLENSRVESWSRKVILCLEDQKIANGKRQAYEENLKEFREKKTLKKNASAELKIILSEPKDLKDLNLELYSANFIHQFKDGMRGMAEPYTEASLSLRLGFVKECLNKLESNLAAVREEITKTYGQRNTTRFMKSCSDHFDAWTPKKRLEPYLGSFVFDSTPIM